MHSILLQGENIQMDHAKRINTNALNWLHKPRNDVYVACSGGVDSIALAIALAQTEKVTLAFFHHGNALADAEEAAVEAAARDYGLPLVKGKSSLTMPKGVSKEEFWRDSRYEWFRSLDGTVATGHTLDDAVEWYLFTCLRGSGHFMPYRHANVVRPFLLSRKRALIEFCVAHGIQWFEDPTNADPAFAKRNLIRHELLPQAERVNPGLFTTVKNRIAEITGQGGRVCDKNTRPACNNDCFSRSA